MKVEYSEEKIEIKARLPILPLRDIVIFPHMIYPLLVGRQFTISALQEAMLKEKQMFLCSQKTPEIDEPNQKDLYNVGVIARILQIVKLPNGTIKVLVEGLVRAKMLSFRKASGFYAARLRVIPPDGAKDKETIAISRSVMEQFSEYVRLNHRIPEEVLYSISSIGDYQRMADTIAAHLLIRMKTKQNILEIDMVKKQFLYLSDILKEELEILQLEQKIDGNVRESMSKSQREFYLQQQLKAIKEELGQFDEAYGEIETLNTKLEKMKAPVEVKDRCREEIEKLSRMHAYSAEAAVARGYVDWLLGLPWRTYTKDRSAFGAVKSILDGDHYGLEKPKKRILEHLAVMRLAGEVKGPILCLVGPPGVGKTSLGRSIARALNRKFVRMSLGGIHDEAEIRGHRRTYIGSLPGRIIQSIKKAGSSNPVFLLDEVDKVGKDFRGDPASALLEVLDPEQNKTFSDNYLELDYDLSRVLFITTANSTVGIPPALLDRMEIIRLPGYLEHEKEHIIRGYVLPKLKKELGMVEIGLDFNDKALLDIIRNYTRESGVRQAERQLASVLRKTAQEIVEKKRRRKFKFTPTRIAELLGAPPYVHTDINTHPEPGYAIGLAWTEAGGEVLPIEVSLMSGESKLTITGKIGEVMQESASAGLTYIRSHAAKLGLDPDFFKKHEIHVHVPEGAVPKDGPSAGITILVAILSALKNQAIKPNLAMTGEVTLSGDILAVGGLNEKLLAAKRLGITDIIMPFKNKKDMPELPKELTEGMNIVLIKKAEEAIKIAFEQKTPAKKTRAKKSAKK